MGTLLLHLADAAFRSGHIEIENFDAIEEAAADGRGAIVAGFHLGPHAALPLLLAQLGHDVAVVAPSTLGARRRLAEGCLPDATSRITWLDAGDTRLLARARSALRKGALLVAFTDLPEREPLLTADVTLLGRTVRGSTALPYLSSITGAPIVPACLTRGPGPRVALRLDAPLPAPARDEASLQETAQALFHVAERRLLEHPEQWLGWTALHEATMRQPTPAVAPSASAASAPA
jgi:lauroyl/myristoyl acyltransferase